MQICIPYMVGIFTGINFAKQTKLCISEIFVLLIPVVSDSRTCVLGSWMGTSYISKGLELSTERAAILTLIPETARPSMNVIDSALSPVPPSSLFICISANILIGLSNSHRGHILQQVSTGVRTAKN